MTTQRDYSTISPSARQLLLVRAQTSLPFAMQAAELVFGSEAVAAAAAEAAANPGAAPRQRHFELRASSLDRALDDLDATIVLEIAAGLSFRGLARAERAGTHYLDTDLPALASLKQELVTQLHPAPLAGTLRVEPLDALDAGAFRAAVSSLPAGPIAIVHEGLLMYLDDAEKARLAANIREALRERGGAWLTADIYVRSDRHLFREARVVQFLAEHRVEERKFADWAAADAFFAGHGFTIARKIAPSADPWRVRETWTMVVT
jgi:O-methyltransferase involved in polyketide biosynthesis